MTVCVLGIIEKRDDKTFLKDFDTGEVFPVVNSDNFEPGMEGLFIGNFFSGKIEVTKNDIREFLQPFFEEDVILKGSEFYAEAFTPFDLTFLISKFTNEAISP